jgi:Domain of unknown function (DUF4404)
MDPETLSLQLAALHADLKGARELDPQSRQLLAEVLADIQRLMAVQGDAAEPPSRSIADRLENIVVRFEAGHPTLAASSRRLIDLLGTAGL